MSRSFEIAHRVAGPGFAGELSVATALSTATRLPSNGDAALPAALTRFEEAALPHSEEDAFSLPARADSAAGRASPAAKQARGATAARTRLRQVRGRDPRLAPRPAYNGRDSRLANIRDAISRHEAALALARMSASAGTRGLILQLTKRLRQARDELAAVVATS